MDYFNISKDLLNLLVQVVMIVLQLLSIIFVVRALNFTAHQIQLSEKTHAESLDWQRKLATDHILQVKPDRKVTNRLADDLKAIDSQASISAEQVDNVVNDKGLKLDVHHYLNWYERLARGMKMGIYDSTIVKEALRNTFVKVYRNYAPYIEHRREHVNPKAWQLFKEYAELWEKEMLEEEGLDD